MTTEFWQKNKIGIEKIDTIQINLGNLCNQACKHCHINASPTGKKNMDAATAERVLQKLLEIDVSDIEFTGGAPEMNPHLEMFIKKLGEAGKRVTVRTNFTVLELPEYARFIEIYKKYKVKVIGSLPDIFEDTVDKQRGKGTFEASIRVLQKLNAAGYGRGGLEVDLVYNPTDDFLPPTQYELERKYKNSLSKEYGIKFNKLLSIVNIPIERFRRYLSRKGKLKGYIALLRMHYNADTLSNLMCRHILSIDYQGYVYNCDFNLAEGKKIKGYEDVHFWEIDFDNFAPEITFSEYCYGCTANLGSSCYGALVDNAPVPEFNTKEIVREYYGEEIQQTSDLKTAACCPATPPPENIRAILPLISDEIKQKYYGCGSPIPECIEGLSVLDLGCGTGKDVYIAAKLVGEEGQVAGIDMTENQIAVAKKYEKHQAKAFGFQHPNTKFVHDYIENIDKHFDAGSIDLVISNCVINLLEDKYPVLDKVHKILRPGGEFYFSDVYADRRVPSGLRQNPVLYGECLGGALYYKDFVRASRKAGFADPREMERHHIDITNREIRELVGNINFFSITYRLWKIEGIEDACEDYGHIAIYKGGIPGYEFKFQLDSGHTFEKGKPERICGNTAKMLGETRFRKYFKILGDFTTHFGAFEDCGTSSEKSSSQNEYVGGGCCSC